MCPFSLEKELRNWFIPKEEHLKAFANADTRVESWFKGESIVLFQKLHKQNVIKGYHREHAIYNLYEKKNNKIDFIVNLYAKNLLIEYKALCISQSDGTPRNLNFYFREDNLGLIADFSKMENLKFAGEKWVVGFIYPNPGLLAWSRIVSSVAANKPLWQSITDPNVYPPHLYISLWYLNSN